MLRVVSVCRTLPTPESTGAGVFVARRLAAMAAGAHLRVLQPVPYFPGLRPLPRWATGGPREAAGLEVYHRPMAYLPGVLKSLDGYWLARSIAPQLRFWQRTGGIDLVDAHFGYPDGVGAVLAARRLKLPVFVTVRGLETDRLGMPLIRRQIISALQFATGCISVSHGLRDLLVKHGAPADRFVVVPNAVERQVFRPGNRRDARIALGIPLDRKLIVSVGNLIHRKRHDVLIAALTRLMDKRADYELAIVGGHDCEPRYPDLLRRLVAESPSVRSIRLVGSVAPNKIATWLQAADLFALATAREGCCNAVLEALACGKPVVTTPVGDNPQYVKDGVNGYLVPVDDPGATADALRRALQRDWDADRISMALPVGGWEQTGRTVLEFFDERLEAVRGKAA